MNPGRCLIVNADDFGLSPGVNHGIIRAHEHGIVTSASLMVRWPAAPAAAEYARTRPKLSLGLHVDLGEWTVVNGAWQPAYQVVPTDEVAAVAGEVARQLDLFRRLVGRNPTHLDSHQHVHRSEPVHSILLAEARNLGVVLRSFDPTVRYYGDFYGQADKGDPYPQGITAEALIRIIQNLPLGITELGCHPGEWADVNSMYSRERVIECRTLCDPRVHAAIRVNGVVLCSFYDRPGQGEASRTR